MTATICQEHLVTDKDQLGTIAVSWTIGRACPLCMAYESEERLQRALIVLVEATERLLGGAIRAADVEDIRHKAHWATLAARKVLEK